MTRNWFCLFFFLTIQYFAVSAQSELPLLEIDTTVYEYVEKPPVFPGGEMELLKFLNKNIKYPDFSVGESIETRCVLTFIVEKDGSLSNIKILKGDRLGEQTKHIIEKYPLWIPGERNGKKVRVKYILPFSVHIE